MNEDRDDINKIIKSLEHFSQLINNCITWLLINDHSTYGFSSLIQPIASSLIASMRVGIRQELPLMKKILGKGVTRAGRGYNMVHMDFESWIIRIFSSSPSFK